MMDVEGVPLNPYSQQQQQQQQSTLLPGRHPVIIGQRLVCIGVSVYGLQHFHAYQVIFQSPYVRHEWFKIGLASSIAFTILKAYVEIFEGKINKKVVNYKEFRQSTHLAIILLLLSSLSFNISLWPHYRWNTLIVLSLFGFGVILPLCLLIPSWLQNIVSFVLLTYFLQEYK